MGMSMRGYEALAAEDWETATRQLSAALALWRGEFLEDVTSWPLHEREVPQLLLTRLVALEARIELDLHRGRAELQHRRTAWRRTRARGDRSGRYWQDQRGGSCRT